jgi:hypothetical protein
MNLAGNHANYAMMPRLLSFAPPYKNKYYDLPIKSQILIFLKNSPVCSAYNKILFDMQNSYDGRSLSYGAHRVQHLA